MNSSLTRTVSLGLAALALALASSVSEAAQWKYSLGVHDMLVGDVDSTTLGIGSHAEVDDMTPADRHRYASFDVYRIDEDHLDPDHIPVWWETNLGVTTSSGRARETCSSAG